MLIAPHPKGFVWALSALAAALITAVVPETADARLIKRLDFDTGNFRQWSNIHALSHGAEIVRRPRTQGRYAARFLVRPGDDPISASGERAEVLFKTGEHGGVESWWKWSTRFPKGFRPSVGYLNVFTQWHHSGPSCHPPIQFAVNGWERPYRLQLRVSGGHLDLARCDVGGGGVFDLGPLRRGRWLTFVFHVRWSPRRDIGFVEVWRNGSRIVRRARVPTIYAGYDVYVKQGYFRKPARWQAAVFHDGMRRFSARPRSLR